MSSSLYLLDTNIIIHYSRGREVGQQIERDYSLLDNPYRPLICIVSRGEALAFALKRTWGAAKQSALQQILNSFVTVDINDEQVIQAYGSIDVASQAVGRKMGKNDLWIASVAEVAQACLMTTDGDFDHLNDRIALCRIDQNTGKTLA